MSYRWILRICLSASNQKDLGDWVGWIKSRFPSLVIKLEGVQGEWDSNPSEYIDTNILDPNVVFYWVLIPVRLDFTEIHSVAENFALSVRATYQGPVGSMGLLIVEAAQLVKESQPPRTNAYWRTLTRNQQMIPVYSNHLAHYTVGHLPTNLKPIISKCHVLGQ